MTTSTKILIVLSGLPYSGKSKIAAQLGGLVLSRDEIVESLLADPVKQMIAKNLAEQIVEPVSKARETKEANAMNDALTVLYVNEIVELIHSSGAEMIICDGTHLQKLSRAFIQQFPEYRRVAIAVKTPPDVCVDRLAKSPPTGFRATVTPEMIRKLDEVTEWPTIDEGFDEVVQK